MIAKYQTNELKWIAIKLIVLIKTMRHTHTCDAAGIIGQTDTISV